jgi:UDP-N-acetylglucosamine 1-carboxyvinyltransferase
MTRFIIEGGIPLKGEAIIRGAKNSGFKLLISSMFSDNTCLISNLTKAGETKIALSIIKYLGGEYEFIGDHSVQINSRHMKKNALPQGVGKESRASTMFAPALLYRFGEAKLPWPGGDKIGNRPLDRHFEGFKSFGVNIEEGEKEIKFKIDKKIKGCRYKFSKPTHTGTDTMIMMASWAEGETILENTAQEPEVDDLISFMNKMGADIKRLSPSVIRIKGVKKFRSARHLVIPDRNEAVTFACAALGTKGSISIFNIEPLHLIEFNNMLIRAGAKIEIGVNEMKVSFEDILSPTNIETIPHPGFMTDWQALWATLMTQARGKSSIIERVYPNRFQYVQELNEMGARIKLFNPQIDDPKEYYYFNPDTDDPNYYHGAYIYGPTKLKGKQMRVNDIRAGATLTLAALIANGKSIILDAEKIERGYEELDARLRNLGGKINKI